jgi:glycosyltransferase involved in cell wall biosynthesis
MKIGFDISQTGSGKAGCGYYDTHAMSKAMLAIAPQHHYSLYPSFGDFFFDPKMPVLNPYGGEHVSYGPSHLTRETARAFWNQPELEVALGHPDIIHANNFWMPVQIASGRLIYTLYDVGFTVNPDWTTEANRIGCFDGIFRSSVAADWVVAISEYSREHYLRLFPHFPSDRVRVVYPCSRFEDSTQEGSPPSAMKRFGAGEFWLSVGTIEPRKNQRLLAQAYARYLEVGGRPIPLVLAGGKGWLMEDFQEYLAKLGFPIRHSDRLCLRRRVDLAVSQLLCNLYPSVFEGSDCRCWRASVRRADIVSNATSMPEVAGNAASCSPARSGAGRNHA